MRLEASKKVLLVHVPQGAAKLQAVKLFSFFKNYIFLFICHIVTLKPLEGHGQVVPFWKPPISNCLEPGGQGGGKLLRVSHTCLRMAIL